MKEIHFFTCILEENRWAKEHHPDRRSCDYWATDLFRR